MKVLMMILIALPMSGFAIEEQCLDLSGKYSCRGPDGRYVQVTVEQDGNEFYLEGIDPLDRVIADGQTHQVPNGSDYRNASYNAVCNTQNLTARGKGELYQSGFYLGKADFTLVLSKERQNYLSVQLNGSIQGTFSRTPIRHKASCRPL